MFLNALKFSKLWISVLVFFSNFETIYKKEYIDVFMTIIMPYKKDNK